MKKNVPWWVLILIGVAGILLGGIFFGLIGWVCLSLGIANMIVGFIKNKKLKKKEESKPIKKLEIKEENKLDTETKTENNSIKLDRAVKISIMVGIFLIALSTTYYFIIRPIQRDYKLEKCIYGAGVVLEDGDTFQRYEQSCIEKYGN